MTTAVLAPEALFQAGGPQSKELNPLITYDPVTSETSHGRYAILWKVAAVASAVAFIALATTGVIFASLFAEAYLPVATILAFYPGMPLSLIPIRNCWHKAQENMDKAINARDVAKHFRGLKDSELQGKISDLVKPGIEAKKLKSIYAQYLVLLDRKKGCEDRIAKLSESGELVFTIGGEKVKASDYSVDKVDLDDKKQSERFRRVQVEHRRIQEDQERAAYYNLEAANCLRLMARPHEDIKLLEFVTILNIPLELRNQAHCAGDRSAFVMAKTPSGMTWTPDTLAGTAPEELAKEIFHVGADT